ncbi:hypothetical protein [Algibacter aquimarinus]|uniref:Uncharacterized protein n=1 Tax=Algibacter aquimarinus TaxID=1136748 RepID=A0ABP9H5X9_9FLAO
MKRFYLIMLNIFLVFSCKDKDNRSTEINLDGEYFYSKGKNISYFLPKDFTLYSSTSKNNDDKFFSSIRNPKLKNLISENYIEGHILPITENFKYLYKEDSTNYQNIFINEVKYLKLNDAMAEILSAMNKRFLNKVTKDSTSAIISLEKDYIINKTNYQIIVNTGKMILKKDTTYWENYIISKFNKTFTITTKSSKKGDFLPYINKIQSGDKR